MLDGWPCPSQVTLTTFTPGLHPAQACSSEGPGMLGSIGCRASPIESRSASVPACWQPCCWRDSGLPHLPCPDYTSCVESACHDEAVCCRQYCKVNASSLTLPQVAPLYSAELAQGTPGFPWIIIPMGRLSLARPMGMLRPGTLMVQSMSVVLMYTLRKLPCKVIVRLCVFHAIHKHDRPLLHLSLNLKHH